MRPLWRTLDAGDLRTITVVCASVLLIGLSYGATAHDTGLAWWQALVIATVVLAGSSEFVFLGVLAAGGVPLIAAAAGLMINIRHLGYGLAVGHLLPCGWKRVVGAHLINDESTALAAAESEPRRGRAALIICGLGVLLTWPLGAALGTRVGAVADPATLGLDAAFPALLFALALPAMRDRSTLAAVALGAVLALATTPYVPAGVNVMVGLLGVVAVELIQSLRGPREPVVEERLDTVSRFEAVS